MTGLYQTMILHYQLSEVNGNIGPEWRLFYVGGSLV